MCVCLAMLIISLRSILHITLKQKTRADDESHSHISTVTSTGIHITCSPQQLLLTSAKSNDLYEVPRLYCCDALLFVNLPVARKNTGRYITLYALESQCHVF